MGGVTEVLPKRMIYLANPDPEDIIEKLSIAIPNAKNITAHSFHEEVKNMYNWMNVAKRTEKVYDKVMNTPRPTLKDRFKKYYSVGPAAGVILLVIIVIDILFALIINIFSPAENIDKAINFPY